jgi:hypothetical protein
MRNSVVRKLPATMAGSRWKTTVSGVSLSNERCSDHGVHRAAAAAYAPYDAALFRSRLHQIESASPPFLMIKSAT